jgi:hypothetical protein
MKVLIGMGHPAHVHFFKNTIWNLEKDGHEVKIVARPRDFVLDLLKAYGFDYELFGKYRSNFITKVLEIPYNDYIFYKVAKEFKPDIFTGVLNYTSAHIGKLIGRPSIIFTDTEHATLNNLLTLPFSTVVCTPSCFKKDLGKKQVRYDGYHELAYLHPNYFKPDPSVLDNLGVSKYDKFIILRFVSWNATHDIKRHGFTNEKGLIKKLEAHGRVFITSERKLSKNLEGYRIPIPPAKIHDLLYYAAMYIGEGSTMAIEAGLLGTPSIYISPLVGTMGNLKELEDRFKLVYSFIDPEQALLKALLLLEDKNVKIEWKEKRKRLLDQKTDVTKFIIEFIENYPDSLNEYKERQK